MTAVEVLCSPALLWQVREDFRLAQLSAEKSSKGSDTASTAPLKQGVSLYLAEGEQPNCCEGEISIDYP